MKSWFENLRKWIDGEEAVDEQGKPRPRSKWEDFLVAIAREVEETMQREMFTPPGGPTYIPREYIVFLSTADDADWQGEKREGLERGLHHVLSNRARELVGTTDFQTKTFTVELRIDAALAPGHFKVQHIWDSQAEKTMVRPKKRAEESALTTPVSQPEVEPQQEDDEATIVRARKPREPVFSVSVRRDIGDDSTAPLDVRPFFKDEITIGRGSKQVEVDLKLEGDLEISRKHATLARQADGSYRVSCLGANPILVTGLNPAPAQGNGPSTREVPTGESLEVTAGDHIAICSYQLTVV